MKRAKKLLIGALALIVGLCVLTVASVIISYNAVCVRFNRPDYAIYPGVYCYERVREGLERQAFRFSSDKNELQGYYYPSGAEKGLVVVVHGFRSGADDYLPIIQFLVREGYNVFAYDGTGTYDSDGSDTVGMCQQLVDLDYALKYISATPEYAAQKLFLLGHSWGGYAAASVLALHGNAVSACALIAPMNDGSTLMLEKGEEYVGKLAYASAPVFYAYQSLLFGDYVNYDGVGGINSVDIPVFIAHGIADDVITYSGQSITAHRSRITNPNVSYYSGVGLHGDHNGIWHSADAAIYRQQVTSGLNRLELQKGAPLTHEERAAYYETVDHALYSEVNSRLMDRIVQMFDGTLSDNALEYNN